jgi:hypothetical protein
MPTASVYSATDTTESLKSSVSGIRSLDIEALLVSIALAWVSCGWGWSSSSSGLGGLEAGPDFDRMTVN